MKITISEVLKGCTPGKMQSVGYMQVIPLLSPPDMVDLRFAPFTDLISGTEGYGNMYLENKSNMHTIFPMCGGILTKTAAQNHGIGKTKLMAPKSRTMMDHAACIQQTQGGYISKGLYETTIMPYSMRYEAIRVKDVKSYGKLWPAISDFNKEIGTLRTNGHLEYYLEEFGDKLDEFIGQFEIVQNQVGAIILLNGQVAGIERAPNYEFWKALWKPLIRESYGSASLIFGKKGVKHSPPLGRMPINDHNVKDIDSLETEFNLAQKFEEDSVKQTIRDFINKPFKATREENEANGTMCVDHLSGGQFIGQIVRDDETIVYASLIPDRNAKFNTAESFEI